MGPLVVLFNPRSGRNRRAPARERARLARAVPGVPLVGTSTPLELADAAKELAAARVRVVGIAGGDGTAGRVVGAVLAAWRPELGPLPAFALLRGGTMNTVANSVGVPRRRPLRFLVEVRDALEAGRPLDLTPRGTLVVGARTGFLFGTGAVHGFLAAYYAAGDGTPTPLTAAKTLARGVGSTMLGGDFVQRMAAPFRGSVELDDGTTWPSRPYLAVAGGTVADIGLGFRPFPRFAERDGAFHLLGIHASKLGFVLRLPAVHRARSMGPGATYEAVTRWAVIHGDDGRVPHMVDGDLEAHEGPLRVEAGPSVSFVRGPAAPAHRAPAP